MNGIITESDRQWIVEFMSWHNAKKDVTGAGS
jgi:hypothetical protein